MEGIIRETPRRGVFTPNSGSAIHLSKEACILLREKATLYNEVYSVDINGWSTFYEITVDDEVYNNIVLLDRL